MDSIERAKQFDASYAPAKRLAAENGLILTNPSDGCYQLRDAPDGWIINLYGRRSGMNPRAYHDKSRPGPWLELPRWWNLVDAVNAAIGAVEKVEPLTE